MLRLADVVRMASYAPLFAHVDAWQWTPDLIWTDNLRTLLTANYHVQRLFARNRGDRVLPVNVSDATSDEQKRFYVSAVADESSNGVIIKLVNATPRESNPSITLKGANPITRGTVTPTYPVIAYPHRPGGGDAIAGGFVYRRNLVPALRGKYVFGDISTGRIWYADYADVLAADDGKAATLAAMHEPSVSWNGSPSV